MDLNQMIQSLRNRHRYIWIVLGIIIPFGFVTALYNIPTSKPGSLAMKPEVVQGPWTTIVELEKFSISRATQDERNAHIKIELREPWKSPFVTVYQRNIEGPALGRIGGIGNYYFKTQGNLSQLMFYDEIKEKILLTVQLK